MAVVNAVQKKKSVADPSSVYESMRPLWQKSRAIIGGERFAKDFDGYLDVLKFSNLLLPFSPSMTPQQYEFYKAEAELPGIVSQYARTISGGLLRKQPQLTLPDDIPDGAYDWIMSSFSQTGLPLVSFLDDALDEELQTSRAWVHVDFPVVENANDLTKEEMQMIKPYPVLWNAESIINWRLSINPTTGVQQLQQIIIRNYVEEFTDNEFHPTFLDTVWVHELVDGYYQVRKYQRPNEDSQIPVVNGKIQQVYQQMAGGSDAKMSDYRLVSTNTSILMNGERLTQIPAWPLNGSTSVIEPMLMPFIDREVSLYNKISRRNHLLYGAATYTPIISSDMTDEDFEAIVSQGLGSWIKLRQGDTATILDTPTGALIDMDRAIAAGIEDMAKLGVRMLTPETAQSGVALEIRNAGQTAQLGTLNTKIGNQMATIIAFMLNWRYGLELESTDIGFELSADFNPTPLGADWLRLATEWYEKGLIPRSVWLIILKQNDMLAADYDDEEGKSEINQDDMVFTTKDNMDFAAGQVKQQAANQEALDMEKNSTETPDPSNIVSMMKKM
jgi:hypothetical protein